MPMDTRDPGQGPLSMDELAAVIGHDHQTRRPKPAAPAAAVTGDAEARDSSQNVPTNTTRARSFRQIRTCPGQKTPYDMKKIRVRYDPDVVSAAAAAVL